MSRNTTIKKEKSGKQFQWERIGDGILQQNRSNWKCLAGKYNNRGRDKDTQNNE